MTDALRYNWTIEEVVTLMKQPFNDLIFQAQQIHRENFNPNEVQVSTLLSIKTGACPEDCSYCSQSARNDTGLEKERLLPLAEVIASAKDAQATGATRFCMGAAWRNPTDKNLDKVIDMVEAVRDLGLETCLTVGMLTGSQVGRLKDSGLDYYNHNLDTSPEFYGEIITTRVFQDRLDTLEHVRNAGIHVCSGGILGLGEAENDRASMLCQLANLPKHPESVPLNKLVQIEGTPLNGINEIEDLDFVRTIAAARIMMPHSYVRLSAGRTEMTDELQALCFFSGANSMFYGDRLLTTDNPDQNHDELLFEKLGLKMAQGKSVLPESGCSAACS